MVSTDWQKDKQREKGVGQLIMPQTVRGKRCCCSVGFKNMGWLNRAWKRIFARVLAKVTCVSALVSPTQLRLCHALQRVSSVQRG